jgi:hypothetical protein
VSLAGGPDWGLQVVATRLSAANVVVTSPAAGHDFTFTFAQTGALRMFIAQFHASTAVANRLPTFKLESPAAQVVWYMEITAPVTANQAIVIMGFPGAPWAGQAPAGESPVFMVPFPHDLVVSSGWVLKSQTTNIDAGDFWDQIYTVLG